MDVPREYCALGLRFNKLVDGFVDAYFGDPALSKQIDDEPAPEPTALARRAHELRHELASAGLSEERTTFIDGQLTGLEMSARKLAGETVSFVDEVETYFQVRPAMGDTAAYADAHREIDALLPGTGSLLERYAAHRKADEIDPVKLEPAVNALSSELRDRVRTTIGIPEPETVEYLVVSNEPWSGFNYYLGGYRSRVAINSDLPNRLSVLPSLVAHESYPGHHTEHCRKERRLVDEAQQVEQTIFLVNTPECLVAEGLADLGLRVAVGDEWGTWATSLYADLGLRFDGERAAALARAAAPLNSVRQDVAIMLHDQGASIDDAVAYLVRWSLVPEDRARKSLDFLLSPLWRAYTSTYVEGHRLLGAWLDSGDEQALFLRLLDEPLTPSRIAQEMLVA
jgi:hypothetical protein